MDERVVELQCIMPIANIASILARGILSNELAAKLAHQSVALQAVQDKRDLVVIPGGLKLHQYANLYFHARNPMMFKRRGEAPNLCILRVSTNVFGLKGTVISDQNAASKYARFYAPSQWNWLDFDDIFAMDWQHPEDQIAQWRHSARKCAEVLVPKSVAPNYLIGAHVVDAAAGTLLAETGFPLPISVTPVLFFR